MAGARISHAEGDGKGMHPSTEVMKKLPVSDFFRAPAAHRGAGNNCRVFLQLRCPLDARLTDCFLRCGQSKLGKAVHECQFLGGEGGLGIIAANLRGVFESDLTLGLVNAVDSADAAAALPEGQQKLLLVQADGADHTNACYDNPSRLSSQTKPFLSPLTTG